MVDLGLSICLRWKKKREEPLTRTSVKKVEVKDLHEEEV